VTRVVERSRKRRGAGERRKEERKKKQVDRAKWGDEPEILFAGTIEAAGSRRVGPTEQTDDGAHETRQQEEETEEGA
jgi:hypothetical protein